MHGSTSHQSSAGESPGWGRRGMQQVLPALPCARAARLHGRSSLPWRACRCMCAHTLCCPRRRPHVGTPTHPPTRMMGMEGWLAGAQAHAVVHGFRGSGFRV